MNFLKKNKENQPLPTLAKDKIADLLKTSPEALEEFEKAYKINVLDEPQDTGRMFEISSKQIADSRERQDIEKDAKALNDRIINELLAETAILVYDGEDLEIKTPELLPSTETALVNMETVKASEIYAVPAEVRPQLSGNLMCTDTGPSDASAAILFFYDKWLKAKNPKNKKHFYNMFRVGLDILDLDGLTYEILGMNKNAMGYWLPPLIDGIKQQDFFKVPKTKAMKVPLTLLQMTRLDYGSLTPGTLDIANRFCYHAFDLDENKDYFIKTGTFSSKFDFRNAKVTGAKEVRELGEYLIYIQNEAVSMCSFTATPSFYGVSTTNEWVVREYIEDVENNPCIYKGLPLHTEYRLFVDFDECRVLGMAPYWDPDIMKQRFGHEADANSPHQIHDYIIYKSHEDELMARYNRNKDVVWEKMQDMLPFIGLEGQWSIDVMQNGDDFYVIDMALAANSALSSCVPTGLLKPSQEEWLPRLES